MCFYVSYGMMCWEQEVGSNDEQRQQRLRKRLPGQRLQQDQFGIFVGIFFFSVVKQCPFPLEELVSQFRFELLQGTEVYSN